MDPLDLVVCSKTLILAEKVANFGSGRRSRVMFFDFFQIASYEKLTFETRADHGRPKVVSKVCVSREAVQEKPKQRSAKTSPAFSLEFFLIFFGQPRAKPLLLRPFRATPVQQ